MEFTKLNTGVEMPILGFGVFQIATNGKRITVNKNLSISQKV